MKIKTFLLPFIMMSMPSFSGCAASFEYYDLVVINREQEIYRTKINNFNNAILPSLTNEQKMLGKTFLGYGFKDYEKGVDKKKDFYKERDVVRFKDVKKYMVNKTITIKSIYCNIGDEPYSYLVFGWYDKYSTSGLDEEIMEGFTPMLTDFLKSEGATERDLEAFEVRAYQGDVATIGGDITYDNDVDIFIGAGANLHSTGGVDFKDRSGLPVKGAEDRYTYRISDTPIAKKVFSFMRTKEVRTYFGG